MCAMYCDGRYEADFSCGNTARGVCAETGAPVFIKRWHSDSIRGKNETCVSEKLCCNYVLKYKEIFEENSMIYAVREWSDAVTVTDVVLKEKKLPLLKALDMMIKICAGLCDIEKTYGSFVHADIRPSNFLYDEKEKEIYFIDFETFTFLEEYGSGKITGLLVKGGYTVSPTTEGFAAPEIYTGEICRQSDVYSLGKMFSFLLGLCGYDGIFVHKPGFKLSRDVMRIVKKSTNENIEKRYKSVGELLDEFCGLFNSVASEDENPGTIVVQKEKTAEAIQKTKNKAGKIVQFVKNGDSDRETKEVEKKRQKILYVAGNLCFASELSYLLATRTGKKTVLFESNRSMGISGFDYFIDCRNSANVSFVSENPNPFFCDCRHLYLTDEEQWVMRGILSKSRTAENLYLSDCNIFSEFDISDENELSFLLNWTNKYFDITVVCDFSEKNEGITEIIMGEVDFIVVPVRPNIDEVYSVYKQYKQLCSCCGIPIERLIFVAWEYEDGISMPVNDFRIAVDNLYGGFIPYDSERLRCKNIKGDFFCEKYSDDIYSSYLALFDGIKVL